MAKSVDAPVKHLLQAYPADWPALIGLRCTGPVEAIDADVSTVTVAADKVFRVHDPDPWLLHLELQAVPNPHVDRRVLKYNVLLDDVYDLPVQSVIVLLRPAADGPRLTGLLERSLRDGRAYLAFSYTVVRLWHLLVEALLAGGLGTLPLAPLSDVPEGALPGNIYRMDKRI
jgi:hypothetical protein